ncbi:hypothetical protein AVEN_249630-1 [Araneus ventricosus]|uniref:Uncharacterized protein n=1 Tax=Araneus ventricosus TaxID=182803 RepID=A0A4Y2TD54_ARAVE|nr:hypothetical protein AVEN_249630-1 [Araneus ventricosus]
MVLYGGEGNFMIRFKQQQDILDGKSFGRSRSLTFSIKLKIADKFSLDILTSRFEEMPGIFRDILLNFESMADGEDDGRLTL